MEDQAAEFASRWPVERLAELLGFVHRDNPQFCLMRHSHRRVVCFYADDPDKEMVTADADHEEMVEVLAAKGFLVQDEEVLFFYDGEHDPVTGHSVRLSRTGESLREHYSGLAGA
ncbi:hypothetical protein [Allokutzneria oryzae]|uniref:Uncharacterized protein n=1 Tax=Allokutzneria oryzae TaxID=1378989 RepID=A0ABV6AAK8_9PSEU